MGPVCPITSIASGHHRLDKDPHLHSVYGDAHPCASGSWTQLSIGLINHGARGHTPAYLWVIGMAVCGDKDMAALATIWADNLKVCAPFVIC